MHLSENVRKFRLKKEMTQEQLADLLGVSPQAVSKWETTDTYPDATLLVPLAEALDVSLDRLFNHKTGSMEETAASLFHLLKNAPERERYCLAREMGWQMEKGIFSAHEAWESGLADETENSSYCANDYGFTLISNGKSPFFSVFPEPEEGYGETIQDGSQMREIFVCLSTRESMRAVLYVHSLKRNDVFEEAVLAEDCQISEDKLPTVMEQLERLHIVRKETVTINDSAHTLYFSMPSHRVIALLLIAHEMDYIGSYSLQKDYRQKPWLKTMPVNSI